MKEKTRTTLSETGLTASVKHRIIDLTLPQWIFVILSACVMTFVILFNTEVISHLSLAGGLKMHYMKYVTVSSTLVIVILAATFYVLFRRVYICYFIATVISLIIGVANCGLLVQRNQFTTMQQIALLGDLFKMNGGDIFGRDVMIRLISAGVAEVIIGVVIILAEHRIMVTEKLHSFRIRRRFVIVTLLLMPLIMLLSNYTNPISAFRLKHNLVDVETEGGLNSFIMSGGVAERTALRRVFFKTGHGAYKDTADEKKLRSEDGIYSSDASAEKPNVIVIMSESFWDISQLYPAMDIEGNADAYSDFRDLWNSTGHGHIAVNIVGGGTVTTEFEFLTGFNALTLGNEGEYYRKYCATKKQESLGTYFDSQGYSTLAMHPYDGEFWGRNRAYRNMGFQREKFMDDFVNRVNYRGFISDESLTDEIILEYENNKKNNGDKPLFNFNVSVGNHVVQLKKHPGGRDTYERNYHMLYKDNKMDSRNNGKTNEFLNGVQVTTDALKRLMNYFSSVDDPTVIVFFGDHCPSFAYDVANTYDLLDQVELYQTPFVIWSNYKNISRDYGSVNASYLSELVLDYIGAPDTVQRIHNRRLAARYPVNTKFEMRTADGENLEDELLHREMTGKLKTYISDMNKEDVRTLQDLKAGADSTDLWKPLKQKQ